MHLLGSAASSTVECAYSLLRPAIAFREQGHRQEHRRGSGRESDANYKISVGAEAPFQGRAYIVNLGTKRRSLLPLRLNSFEQSPVVFGMPPGELLQFTSLDQSRESINPSRLKQPEITSAAGGVRRHQRLRNQVCDIVGNLCFRGL